MSSKEIYQIIFDFEKSNEGEITVHEGDHVQILENYDDGWSLCKVITSSSSSASKDLETGLVPTNYCELVLNTSDDDTSLSGMSASSLLSALSSSSNGGKEVMVEDKSLMSADKHVSVSNGFKIVRTFASNNGSGSKKNLYTPTGAVKYSKTESINLVSKFLTSASKRKKLKDWMGLKEHKNSRKRIELVKELLATEESYVQSLRLFVNTYAKPAKANTQLLSEKKSKIIFSNIEQILGINETVLSSIQASMMKWPSKNDMGETFNRMAPFFKAYVTYINNYDAAFELLERCEKKKNKFFQYMTDQTTKNPTEHGLRSLLIMPVQRIPRYKMLLEQILSTIPSDNVEYKHYEAALKTISDVAVFCNERKRQEDDSNVVFTDLKNKLSKHYKALVKPTRKFIKDYIFKIKTKEKADKDEYRGYIFTDVLILSQESGGLFSQLSKKSFTFVYFSFTKLLGRNNCEIQMRYITSGKEIDFSVIAGNEEDAKSLYELFDERIKSIEESQSFKNLKLDRDSYSVGKERVVLADKREDTKQKLETSCKQFNTAEKRLKKLDQSIQNHEMELRRLVDQIAREREEKANTIKEMEAIQLVCADIQVQLKKHLEEIKTRDDILFDKMVHNVDEDFVLIFGEETLTDPVAELKKCPSTNISYMNSSSSYKHIDIQAIMKEVSKVDAVSLKSFVDDSSSGSSGVDSPLKSPPSAFSGGSGAKLDDLNSPSSSSTTPTSARPKHILPPPGSELRKSITPGSDLGVSASKMFSGTTSSSSSSSSSSHPTPPPRPPTKPHIQPPSKLSSTSSGGHSSSSSSSGSSNSSSSSTNSNSVPTPPPAFKTVLPPPKTNKDSSTTSTTSKFGSASSTTSLSTSPSTSSSIIERASAATSLKIAGFQKATTTTTNSSLSVNGTTTSSPLPASPRDKPLPKPQGIGAKPTITSSIPPPPSTPPPGTSTMNKRSPLPPPKKN
ncbi:hypothetical protein C9374_003935 [Naegleria lovaniensis]|uniref:RhoGEF domain-containing protein n=1 Tax=Naegleria lovaniensis TaxID=51637 RepID=A0AA88H5X2_NAELO|nr:uncharacterized protein C9374_003935 [Naegleria lovaniensis]KAG2394171.1 hypothetical protein C9374_003935 [Naegleria lovaniensis]